METITIIDDMGNAEEYEVVQKIPRNYFVWNINLNSDEYVPICKLLYPEAKKYELESNYIDRNTVKVIKLPKNEVKLLSHAAMYGVVSKKTAEDTLNNRSKTLPILVDDKRRCAKQTIEIFKRISE